MLRTKRQEKELCTDCPIARTANLMGDTCTLLIVRDLLGKPKRFGDIATSLSGVSTRTVTKKLQLLEKKKLVVRRAFTEKPPRVEYSLTKKGKALSKVVASMGAYGKKYM